MSEARALAPIDTFRRDVNAMGPQFASALPAHIPIERFKRVLITSVSMNPDILGCDRRTLFAACMKAAQDGLLPDGREAALVKFGNNVQYMPMVGGVLKKVRNSGELHSITAQIVYEKDDFRYWVDEDGEHVQHRPEVFGERGKVLGVYALAKTKDGGIYVEPMSYADVEKVRAVSRAAQNGPWVQWWSEMARKTAIRRLSKRLPMSTDLDDLMRHDDGLIEDQQQEEAATPAQVVASEPVPAPKRRPRGVAAAAAIVDQSGNEQPPQNGKASTPLQEKLAELAALPAESIEPWWNSPDIQNLVDPWSASDFTALKDAVDARLSAN